MESSSGFVSIVSIGSDIPRTKRQILSIIARLFDPFGWVIPVIVAAKILMQQLWRLKFNLDDTVPSEVKHRWEKIYNELPRLNNVAIPRWTGHSANSTRWELHGFADASSAAYRSFHVKPNT